MNIHIIVVLVSLVSAQAVSVNYYSNPVKYVEPIHVNPAKYVQPTPVPVYKTFASPAPIQLTHPAPVHLSHPAPIQYATPAPFTRHSPHAPIVRQYQAAPVKYDAPHYTKYNPHVFKYGEPHSLAHGSPVQIVRQYQPAPVNHVAPKVFKYHPHAVNYEAPHPHYAKNVIHDVPAQYEYAYDVHDDLTGDVKSHTEKRNGDAVVGSYTVLDPDGFKRTVEYTADDHHGFNAVVRREPIHANVAKKVIAPAPQHFLPAEPHAYISQPQRQVYAIQPQQKLVPAPIYKHAIPPQQYYSPEQPKYYRPIEKVAKYIEPHHNALRYV